MKAHSRGVCAVLAAGVALSLGCASIEAGRYGVSSLEITGQREFSEAAITDCLISRERENFELAIGLSDPKCGVPPFDVSPVRLRLWRWPWTEWPTFNRAVFDRDLEGVLRFYRARGYYAARIVAVHYTPEEAGRTGAGRCEQSDCRVDIRVVVDEGEPTRIGRIETHGLDTLPADVRAAARAAIRLAPGVPPDEALHDQSKRDIERALFANGWAGARVRGKVSLASTGLADVEYWVEPGPRYHFGRVEISGQGALPREVIEKAANLTSGQHFDPDVLREIQVEVFALGAFSAVEVEEKLDPSAARADVSIRLTPLPRDALRVGAGVLSGVTSRTGTTDDQSVPQWDVHLFGRYQRRHLFGSLAQLTLEDRPRLIFSAAFPSFESPQPGNVISVALSNPGWPEARTTAFARTVWDYGPDPYLGFLRSDLFLRLGLTRGFWGRRLIVTAAAQQDVFSVFDSSQPEAQAATAMMGNDGPAAAADMVAMMAASSSREARIPSSYRYTYLEQDLRLDLRDSRTRPSEGAYFALNATEAPRWSGSDWTAFRLSPEVRTYLSLPLDVVFAQRFAIAGLFVHDANPELDELSVSLGPNNYRLRGGGASSNRGFLAGRLGEGLNGGTRRWETSLELRIPIGQDWVVAGFADFGDVSRGAVRFSHLNTSLGYGLRYYTLIGAIRLDVGYRIVRWQRSDGSNGIEDDANSVLFSELPGAVHLTIGDPF